MTFSLRICQTSLLFLGVVAVAISIAVSVTISVAGVCAALVAAVEQQAHVLIAVFLVNLVDFRKGATVYQSGAGNEDCAVNMRCDERCVGDHCDWRAVDKHIVVALLQLVYHCLQTVAEQKLCNTSLQNAVTATTAAAVAVCKAIEKTTDLKPKIKWVNDVYLNGKKVCGILTEATTDFESGTVDSVIIGIGINISTTKFPSDVQGAGCLDVDVNRSALIAQTVNELMKIAGGDYASFIDYYRSHSMVIGEKIKFIQNGEANLATATAIDEKGGLEVELENGEKTVLRSGEITVRKV